MLIIDAGDLFFRRFSQPYAEEEKNVSMKKAWLILECFNLMGYHALGVGDDDLSLGREFLLELAKKARFPFLSSNLVDSQSKRPLLQQYLIKQVKDIKVGIFSLISQNSFMGSADVRLKGLSIHDPFETANEILRKISREADLVVLLSHLGYPGDRELAEKVSGIDLIIGGHTNINLRNPPVSRSTIIAQNSNRGMEAQRLTLTVRSKGAGYYNIATKNSLESSLASLRAQLSWHRTSETEKVRVKKSIENIERNLRELERKNPFTFTTFPLSDTVQDHPQVKALIDRYKSQLPERKGLSLH